MPFNLPPPLLAVPRQRAPVPSNLSSSSHPGRDTCGCCTCSAAVRPTTTRRFSPAETSVNWIVSARSFKPIHQPAATTGTQHANGSPRELPPGRSGPLRSGALNNGCPCVDLRHCESSSGASVAVSSVFTVFTREFPWPPGRLRPCRWSLARSLWGLVLGDALTLSNPLIIRWMADDALPRNDWHVLILRAAARAANQTCCFLITTQGISRARRTRTTSSMAALPPQSTTARLSASTLAAGASWLEIAGGGC